MGDLVVEAILGYNAVDPTVGGGRRGIERLTRQHDFEGTVAANALAQVLRRTPARSDAHESLDLTDASGVGGEAHIGCSDELGSAATGEAAKFDDCDLRLVPDQLSDRLEDIHPCRRGLGHLGQDFHVVGDAHVDVCEKELRIGALEHDDLHRRSVPHVGQQISDLSHHRRTEHVHWRVVQHHGEYAAGEGGADSGEKAEGHD
nr:hypothetical protein [Nocardia anaemiae]